MKQRIYIDTSAFGGYFDEVFKDHTIPYLTELIQENTQFFIQQLFKKN